MPIRLSGINSGLDTDALVKELVSAYSLKTEKYEKQKTKVEWKKDAWQGLNAKIYGLYTSISNLRYDSAYNLKKTSVSDSTKAKVTASGTAISGTQKLEITETAQAAYLTGAKRGNAVTNRSTLSDLGYTGEATTIEVRTEAGDIKTINVTKDTKISDVVSALGDAGLTASFDENNKRFFISSKESGEANDFDLCATDSNSQNALKALGLNTSLTKVENGQIVFTSAGAAYEDAYNLQKAAEAAAKKAAEEAGNATDEVTVDIESYLKELLKGYQDGLDAQQKTIDDNKQVIEDYKALEAQRDARDAFDSLYKKIEAENWGLSEEQVYDIAKELYKVNGTSQDDVKKYFEDNTEIAFDKENYQKLAEILNTSKDDVKLVSGYKGEQNLLGTKLEDIKTSLENSRDDYDTAVNNTDKANAAIAEIKGSYYAELLEIEDEATLNAEIEEIKARVTDAVNMMTTQPSEEDGAIKIEGKDAKIILNGAEFTSATNSFNINGITIEAQAVTTEAISITTAVDTEGIYDKIKDFLTQYNSIINEITKLYNADTAKGYEPLTDEERDAMSDTEIEKWETKIKDSILRRDSSLGSVMNAMINSMSQTFEVGGKKLSLGNFGISTLGFLNAGKNEQYAYHIDGDEDDSSTSGKEDKLMKAIQENPDEIIEFMKKLTSSLYSSIDEKMKSTELSSVYKVYNDKEIDKEIKSIEDLIKKWQEKVEAEEDRYYKQFSQMEVALSKLQSQTNSLTGLLGQ